MKKTMMLLTLLLVITLTGCSENPFEVPKEGYELIKTNEFLLIHNDGLEQEEVYSYTFTNEYYMYIPSESLTNEVHYDFTNINNYKDISDDFKAFIESFEFIETDEQDVDYGNKVDFSKGASEDDYNYKTIKVNEATDVYANITTSNGVQIRATYTIFDTEEGILYIPSYVVIETIDLHQSIRYDFLADTNDYNEIDVAIINYKTSFVALPPRTAYETEWEIERLSDLDSIDYFTRVYSHEYNQFGVYEVCTIELTTDCVDAEYFTLQAQVYDATIDDVQDFYINNFRGSFDGIGFYFISDNTTFRITSFEEGQVTDSNGERITVVNMTIEFY